MSRTHRRYKDFVDRIDVDAFEDAINFEFIENDGKGNDRGYCPDPWGLHKNGDTTGKCGIHRDKKIWGCFVCGGGTLLSLGMAVWNLGEDDAIDKMLEFVTDQSDDNFEDEINLLLADKRKRSPVIPWFNEKVLDPFREMAYAEEPIAWFKERRISPFVVEDHKIGFDPLAKKIHKRGIYEGPGIIFPHFWQERLVGWQTRWLESDKDRPSWVQKYNNTRDMPKKYTIYNYESVYFSEDPIIVVESVPTALFLESQGYASIATFGGSVTDEQMKLLRSCQQGLILAPDNDKVGIKFAISLAKELDRYIEIRVVDPVGKEDSGDDLADVKDVNEVKARIEDAIDIGLL